MIYLLSLRYFWNNGDLNDQYEQKNYKIILGKVLSNEFSNSFSSLPSPNFSTIFKNCDTNDPDNHYELLKKSLDNPINLYRS